MDRAGDEIVALIEASRPLPRPTYRGELERRLFAPAPRRRAMLLRRPAIVAGLATVAMAVAVLLAALAGHGPVTDNDPVRADDDCRRVLVTTKERVPFLVTDADGRERIRYRVQSVTRSVERCD